MWFFFSTGDNLFISVRALNLCACSCVCLCVLADRCSSSQTMKIPPQQVNLGEANTCAQKNRFFIPDGSIVFCSGEISWEHSAGHSFEPLQLALYIYSSIRIKMNARKKKKNGGSPDATELLCREGKWNQGKLLLLLPLWQLHAECTLIFLFWVLSGFWSFSEYDFFIEKMRSLIIYVPRMHDHCSIRVSGHWCAAIRVKCFHVQQATIRTSVEQIVCLSCSVPGSSTRQSVLDDHSEPWVGLRVAECWLKELRNRKCVNGWARFVERNHSITFSLL